MAGINKFTRNIVNIALFGSFILIIYGCAPQNSTRPQIVSRPNRTSTTITPTIVTPPTGRQTQYDGIPREWFPPANLEKSWTAIIIHHSATENGNEAIFDKWHREYHHWDGVGYDFVIGNGTDSGDGEVEVTFRWERQIPGAHVGGTPNNWANVDGIGICLVGNFNSSTPTKNQMQSLVKLTKFLQQRYGIPTSRIYGHRTTPDAGVTDCPGANFPMSSFKAMLGS